MAIADMFLQVTGVTGDTADPQMKGQLEVASWSWGLDARFDSYSGLRAGKSTMTDMTIVRKADRATPTLMLFQYGNTSIATATLSIRKAGTTPLVYFTLKMERVLVGSIHVGNEGPDIIERMSLRFQKMTVSYTPQSSTGAVGGGTVTAGMDWNAPTDGSSQ
jgi:type VI secretion system secreted protein Hcp